VAHVATGRGNRHHSRARAARGKGGTIIGIRKGNHRMKIHRRALAACFALLSVFAFASTVQARQSLLTDPAPVSIPAGLSQDGVAKDIKRALMGRGWEVTSEAPGQIEAQLHLREHFAQIKVTYDEKSVQFAYVDSRNLDFENKRGRKYIHRNYLGWMTYLTTDLATNMKLSTGDTAAQ
jgi:hypothetical protein